MFKYVSHADLALKPINTNTATIVVLTGIVCVQSEQQLQHLHNVRETMEAEVAGLQHSITTAHQDKAKAQAEVAALQRSSHSCLPR